MPYAAKYDAEARPSQEAKTDAAGRKDVSGRWIKRWNVLKIRRQLASGHPVAVGMRWPKKVEFDGSHVLAVPPPEEVFDGHSIVLVGYRDAPEMPGGGVFIFRNSSGSKWREAGHAYLPYAYVAAYGNDALSLRLGGAEPITTNSTAIDPIEAETLTVTARENCSPSVQKMTGFGQGLWSGDAQLFVPGKADSSVTLAFPVKQAGRYEAALYATRAPDFARVRVRIDGQPVGDEIDLYAPRVLPTGRILLGAIELSAGEHALHVTVTGKNRASSNSYFGLDCLELRGP